MSEPAKPRVPLPIAKVTEKLFLGLSSFRGKRIFHPHGVGFELELTVEDSSGEGALLGRRGRHRGFARLSRAVGLPGSLPDALGFAFRLADVYGPGRHQDFLLVSSARPVVARHALLPGRAGFFGQFYSTLLPYRIGEKVRMVGLEPRPLIRSSRRLDGLPSAAPGRSFDLCLAPLTGPWGIVAELQLGPVLPDRQTEALRLNPWNTGDGIRPLGPLMGLRRPAYEGSQRGRRDLGPGP